MQEVCFVVLCCSGELTLWSVVTVLKRRREVSIRALNKGSSNGTLGGDRMHVIGRGFQDSVSDALVLLVMGGSRSLAWQPSLAVIVKTSAVSGVWSGLGVHA